MENENSDPDALIFWIGTTILHEYVHYGNFVTGFEFLGEDGRLFETKVYGENVQPDRARIVLNRNKTKAVVFIIADGGYLVLVKKTDTE